MKCQRCQQNEANIHLSQTRQGKTIDYHLCDSCAAELGIAQPTSGYFGSFGNIFGSGFPGGPVSGSVFHTTGGIPAFGEKHPFQTICPQCGQTFEDFRHTGLFGCSRCYDAFAGQLDAVFRRVQGSTHHIHESKNADKQPDDNKQLTMNRLKALKQSLKAAVQKENYENAAKLRDEIRTIEETLNH